MSAGDYWLMVTRVLYVLALFLLTYLTITFAAGEPEAVDGDGEQLPPTDPRIAVVPLLVLVLIAPLGLLL